MEKWREYDEEVTELGRGWKEKNKTVMKLRKKKGREMRHRKGRE
jgi:hypothetical protein